MLLATRSMASGREHFRCRTTLLPQSPPDSPWLAALPGAGAVVAPRLHVTFGKHRERATAAAALPTYTGLTPGTERRGHTCGGHWRLQGVQEQARQNRRSVEGSYG